MRVLVACEYSGRVRDAFAAKGHDAWSCDLLETERPGQHYQGDVRDMLARGDFVLSAALLERIYLAMEKASPPRQTPFDTCPTCEALSRTVMMDQTGAA